MAKNKIEVAGQIVYDDKGVFFMASKDFLKKSLGEQWTVMRAAERAIGRILVRLTDDLSEQNRMSMYDDET